MKNVLAVLRIWATENPAPHCELYYETPYQLLVSVVLSAQATDVSVNKCMVPIYKSGFGPKDVLAMGRENFQKKIKSIGLAPTKAKNVTLLTKILLNKHKGKVPNRRDLLEELPGVGRKTASVVLGELFSQATLAVDTHVFRLGLRLGWHRENTPLKAEKVLLDVIPKKFLPKAHHWMVLHGRYVCKARKPLCLECVLKNVCPKISVDL